MQVHTAIFVLQPYSLDVQLEHCDHHLTWLLEALRFGSLTERTSMPVWPHFLSLLQRTELFFQRC